MESALHWDSVLNLACLISRLWGLLCNGNNHKETNGKSLAICLYWPGAVNYAHLPFTTWQNGLNKCILDTTGDARTQNPLVYLVNLRPNLTKKRFFCQSGVWFRVCSDWWGQCFCKSQSAHTHSRTSIKIPPCQWDWRQEEFSCPCFSWEGENGDQVIIGRWFFLNAWLLASFWNAPFEIRAMCWLHAPLWEVRVQNANSPCHRTCWRDHNPSEFVFYSPSVPVQRDPKPAVVHACLRWYLCPSLNLFPAKPHKVI